LKKAGRSTLIGSRNKSRCEITPPPTHALTDGILAPFRRTKTIWRLASDIKKVFCVNIFILGDEVGGEAFRNGKDEEAYK